jgi:DNA-binding NarL/FixJ family response regulator
MSAPIRVGLVDDHPIVRAGIRALLEAAPELSLVGDASTGAEALQLFAESRPDVAIVDISLPDTSGIEVVRRIATIDPEMRVIVLTGHEDAAYLHPLLELGARGYILKRSAAEDLIRAIKAVAAGGLYLDPAIAGEAVGQAETALSELSPRELEVLRFTALGHSNKEAAAQLSISVKTVETYRARALEKLGIRSRADIVRLAVRRGWLSPG